MGLNSMGGVQNCQNLKVWGVQIEWGGQHINKKTTYNCPIAVIFKSTHPKIKESC